MLARTALRRLPITAAHRGLIIRSIVLSPVSNITSSTPKLAPEVETKHAQLQHTKDLKITAKLLPSGSNDSLIFPRVPDAYHIHHPVYTQQEVESIMVVHSERKTMTDKVASFLVAMARYGFDTVTRYKHGSPEEAMAALRKEGKQELSIEQLRKEGYIMGVEQWMARILFLESVAGVPGMVAGMSRHLAALRLMRRDGGWINSLLQEAENERMHLMTFLAIKQPSKFFRFLVLGAQGVFFNIFFAAYLVSPKACHRFVAFLEEEAVVTYSQIANEIKLGHIPEWSDNGSQKVPQIAKDYWRLGDDATMLDLVLAVRADEAGHRFLNHSLANLETQNVNPFGIKHPPTEVIGQVPGFTQAQSLAWSKMVEEDMEKDLKRERKE